ncbi:MAG: SpoIIE family protein phosphatase [Nocardioides sp.]
MSDADRTLFELAPAPYLVLDRSGMIRAANRAFLALIGGDPANVVGRRTLPSLLTGGGRIYFETHLMPLLELAGRVDEVALEVVGADGTRIPVLLSANVQSGGDGRLGEVRAVLFPARERRRYEADLLHSTRAAEEATRLATELSRTLQQTFIPPVPPAVPRLDVSAVYRPAGDGTEVGGDFYDVFSVADGAWIVVLGDVAGKGVAAATVTAFIRHSVRALAMQLADPAELLGALDRALAGEQTDRFCTIVALRLEDTPDGWVIHGSVGGHPLPLLGRTDGAVTELGTPGSLVGILDEATFTSFTHTLAADEFVVLFTDGVTEAKDGAEQLGSDRLMRLVGSVAADPAGVTDAVVQSAIDFQHGAANDDIAVMTLRPDPSS